MPTRLGLPFPTPVLPFHDTAPSTGGEPLGKTTHQPGETAMHDQRYYLYAFTGANCTLRKTVPGVDPRFNVVLFRRKTLAAVASRVGKDWFDPARLQGKTAGDVEWLSRLAVRHNQVICEAAKHSPVLPLRPGTLLRSRAVLLAGMARCRATVADFLHRRGDHQEWAVRIYEAVCWAEATPGHDTPPPPHYAGDKESSGACASQNPAQHPDRPASDCRLQEQVLAVETALREHADCCCRVHTLPARLVGRHERMAWNAAFLLPHSRINSWLAAVSRLRHDVASRGLFLEVTGPWPPYHFSPALHI